MKKTIQLDTDTTLFVYEQNGVIYARINDATKYEIARASQNRNLKTLSKISENEALLIWSNQDETKLKRSNNTITVWNLR